MAWFTLASVVVMLALAPEGTADPELVAALARYRALDYRAAAPLLETVLAKPGLAVADRQLALAYLGRTRAALRDEPAAVDAFARLLELDPEFELDATESPLFRAALTKAREQRAISRPPPASTPTSHGAAAATTAPALARRTADPTAATRPQRAPTDDADVGWVLGAVAVGGVVGIAAAGGLALLIWQPWATTATGNLGRWELP